MTLHSLQRKLETFDITQEVKQVIEETSGEISELNRDQLFAGIRSDNTAIKPPYSDTTIVEKEKKGQPFDRVQLRDTGAFWASIKVDVKSEEFDIDATDSKTSALTKKYGNKIFGLTKASKYDVYIPHHFFPALKLRIESKLGLKLE